MASSLPNPLEVFEEGTLVKGRYRVVDQVGSGGMAVVFLVHDEDLRGRPAVLKSPFAGPAFKPESLRARFEEEIGNLIEVGHVEGVVDILDQGVHDDAPFYVAAYLPGGTLQERLGPEGRQDPEEVAAWLTPIAQALDAVHARQFVHRDVKPDNILFTEEGLARLADFGIARVFSGDATGLTTGYTRIGTQAYWAPEQEAGIPIDGRADQFGLAATVYRALAGRPPATRGIPKKVREYAPAVTLKCQNAIDRALDADRKKRFETCSEFAEVFAEGITASVVRRTNVATLKAGSAAKARTRTRRGTDARPRTATRTSTKKRPARTAAKTSRRGLYWVAVPVVLGAVGGGLFIAGILPVSLTPRSTQQATDTTKAPDPPRRDVPTPKKQVPPIRRDDPPARMKETFVKKKPSVSEKAPPKQEPRAEPWRAPLQAFVAEAKAGNIEEASAAYKQALDQGAPATAIPAKYERLVLSWRVPPKIQVLAPQHGAIIGASSLTAKLHWTAGRKDDELWVGDGEALSRARVQPGSGSFSIDVPVSLGARDIVFEIRNGDVVRWTHRVSVLQRPGGPTAHDTRIDAALRWLAAHQSPNGGWEAAGFAMWCDGKLPPPNQRPDGLGKVMYDPGVTGLAISAFLGAGYTNHGQHEFSKVVSRGLRYLKDIQDAEGCFGKRSSASYIYSHAIASLAMVEAYGMTLSPIYKGSAQRALDFVSLARNPYFAWRYGIKPGDNDTSVTGWMASVLHRAQLVNRDAKRRGQRTQLQFDESAFEGISAWLKKMTDPDYGRVGYVSRGTGPARPRELVDRFSGEKSESMTAAGVLARLWSGEDLLRDKTLRMGAALVRKMPPLWRFDGSLDMYYWYYGALLMHRVGGDSWRVWDQARRTAIVGNQRMDTNFCEFKGSWDPIGPWGPDGGRVYATALMTLVLETELRFRSPR